MKRIISYNVNGIRAAINKGFIEWLKNTSPDIVCFQEIKANPEQFDVSVFEYLGYNHYWHPAQKKGYSGVAILSKEKPLNVQIGTGNEMCDNEGRIIRADYNNYSVISVYVPSGTTGDVRQDFKYEWLDFFLDYVNKLRIEHPNLIILGDYNICHKPIDIHNPISNANSSGFLPEERAWLSKFIDNNFIDTFRYFHKEPHNYTWWSYRANSREKNLGWRIDYAMTSNLLETKLIDAGIMPEVKHSDHCPIWLDLEV